MTPSRPGRPYLSVVAPLYNESENVAPLIAWILEALAEYPSSFEVILVDDGSRDDTWATVALGAAGNRRIRGLRLGRNVGTDSGDDGGIRSRPRQGRSCQPGRRPAERSARHPGAGRQARGGIRSGLRLAAAAAGQALLRKVPSWVANRIIRRLTGVHITDNGCSLKAYRRDLLDRISLYAEQHRFIPALSASVGARIAEMPVRHHARRFGESKYGISRTVKVLVDLLTLKMITTFRSRPLLGFADGRLRCSSPPLVSSGRCGSVAMTQFGPDKAKAMVFPGAAALSLGTAFYLFMLGLVAEVALSNERESANATPTAWEVR